MTLTDRPLRLFIFRAIVLMRRKNREKLLSSPQKLPDTSTLMMHRVKSSQEC